LIGSMEASGAVLPIMEKIMGLDGRYMQSITYKSLQSKSSIFINTFTMYL